MTSPTSLLLRMPALAALAVLAALALAVTAQAKPSTTPAPTPSPTPAVAGAYYGVDFVTANSGWVAGTDATVAATANGGKVWQTQTSTAGGPALLDVCVLDDGKTGWAVGAAGTVLRTTDGKNWSRVFSGAFDAAYSYTAVEFVDAKTGWIAGGVAAGPFQGMPAGHILGTTDGGLTWQAAAVSPGWCPVALDAVSARSAVCAGVQRVGNGAAAANAPATVRTADGVGWTAPALLRAAVGATGEVWGIALYGARAIVVGDYNELLSPTPATFTSANAGASFSYAAGARTGPSRLRGVSLVSATNGFVVGTGAAAILRTTTGGASWTAVPAPLAKNLYAVDFVDAGTGYAVGRTSAGTAATVLKTTNGGTTWTVVK